MRAVVCTLEMKASYSGVCLIWITKTFILSVWAE